MSPTYLGLSVPVNDCLGNVCRQLFTWMVTCSDMGLIFSEKHKLSGKIITFKAFFLHEFDLIIFFVTIQNFFSKRKQCVKLNRHTLFSYYEKVFCWDRHIFIFSFHFGHVSAANGLTTQTKCFCFALWHYMSNSEPVQTVYIWSTAAPLCYAQLDRIWMLS